MSKYFENFPLINYSLDDGISSFVMTDFFRRVKADANSILGSSAYYEYQLADGDTPEILAHKLYGDPNLHWVILITNETIDPRFDWAQTQNSLTNYIRDKYGAANVNAAHHYENSSGDTVYYKAFTGTVDVATTSAGSSIAVVGTGTAFTTEVLSTAFAVRFGTTTTAYTVVAVNSNTSITVSGAAVTVAVVGKTMIDNFSYSSTVTRVTNTEYEEAINETRRTIRVIKPQYVPRFIESFIGILNNVSD
jgi:hypothetical protein